MTVLSTARSSPGLAKPELRQPLSPPPPPIRAHAFATRVRSSISIRLEAHALPPRVYTSRSKECANVLRASSTRLEKNTPPLPPPFPPILLIQDPGTFLSNRSSSFRKKLLFEKERTVSNSPTLKSDRVFRNILSRLVSIPGSEPVSTRWEENGGRTRNSKSRWSARGEKRNGLKRTAGGREADPRGCIPEELASALSLSRSLVHARVMKLFLHRAPVSCTRTHVHAYVRAPRRFYCSRHTARGIRASKAWRSEKCWKLDIQSVRGTAIPVEILLSSRVAPLCIRSRVARLDKSTDKTIIRNRSYVLPIPTRIILRYDTSSQDDSIDELFATRKRANDL